MIIVCGGRRLEHVWNLLVCNVIHEVSGFFSLRIFQMSKWGNKWWVIHDSLTSLCSYNHIGNVMVSVLILFQVFCLHILPNAITKIISVCFVCRVTVSLLEFCEHLLLVIGGLSDRALWSQGNVITRLSNIRCRNGDLICRQLFALCNYTLL